MTDTTPIYSPLSEDEDFRELVELFIIELEPRLVQMEEAFAQQDWKTLQQKTHQVKGSSGSYGFPLISPAAEELDSLLKSGCADAAKIEPHLTTVLALCRRASAEPEPS